MKIKTLELKNFRCYEEYELEFSDRFTLLIGGNGSGKTAILDGLASAVSPFLENFEVNIRYLNEDPDLYPSSEYMRDIATRDMRHVYLVMGQNPVKEIPFPTSITIECIINSESISWSITKQNTGMRCTEIANIPITSKYAEKITEPHFLLPLITYYDTGRLWKLAPKDINTSSPNSRFSGYRNCLNPASNVEQLFRWFKTQELGALQKQERRHVLEAVRNAIVEMIPDAKHAWWDIDWDELMIQSTIQGKLQTIPFSMLSDGYRNMIGMVADIAYRMATLNPQLEADVIKQTEGIVLIDEIDLHLHPKWQREVVGRLLNTFPKVQFVASSHSPFIIQSLYGRKDCLLWDLEKAQPLAIESESIEDIAEDQQHVNIPQKSKRFLDMMEAAEAYYQKLHEIKDSSDEELIKLRTELDDLTIPFSDDPAFAAQLKFERDTLLALKGK